MESPRKSFTPTTRSGRRQKKSAAAQNQTGLDLSQLNESTAGQPQPASERRGTSVKRRSGRPSVSMLLEDGDTPRHLINRIMQREPAKSPVVGKRRQPEQPEPSSTRSVVTRAQSSVLQEQPANSTHHSSKRLKRNAGPETPQGVLKRNLRERLRSSLAGQSQPASEIKKASVQHVQGNPSSSMLLEDGDTPRHLINKIMQREPAKSPMVGNKGPSKQPESPAASFAGATILSSTDLSSLELSDVTVANLANTAKVSRKRRTRRSFNLTGFEKRLQDAEVRLEPLDVHLASSMSLSQFLSVSTISTGEEGLRRKVPKRTKMSEEEVATAIKRWDITAMNSFRSEQTCGEISSSEVFAAGQSQLHDSEPVPNAHDEVVTSRSKSGASESRAAIPPSALTLSTEEPMMETSGKTITVDEGTLQDEVLTDNQDEKVEDAAASPTSGDSGASGASESPEVGEGGSLSEDDDLEGSVAEEEVAPEASSQLENDEENVAESQGTSQDEVFTSNQDGNPIDAEAPESTEVGEAGGPLVEEEGEPEASSQLEKDENVAESFINAEEEEEEEQQEQQQEEEEEEQQEQQQEEEEEQQEQQEQEEEEEQQQEEEEEEEHAELQNTLQSDSMRESQGLRESSSVEEAMPVEESENLADATETESVTDTPDFVRTKRVFALPEPVASTSVPENTEASAGGSGGNNLKPSGRRVNRPKRKSAAWEKKIFSKSFFVNAFKHYAGTTVARDIYPYLNTTLDKFYARLMEDLETYANHAGRSTITAEDALLLLKRQGHVSDKVPVEVLIEKYLPMEHRRLLLPTASRAMLASKKRK